MVAIESNDALQPWTYREAATYLRMSEGKLRKLVASGAIPHLKIGRNVRFRRLDVDRWLDGLAKVV